MNRFVCPALAATALTTGALGAPIDRAWVDPGAAWVIHVDLEGLLNSEGLATMTEIAGIDMAELENEIHLDLHDEIKLDGKDVPEHVLEAWRNIDFRVTEDLKSITAFGTAGKEAPELIVLRTSEAVDEIIATLDPIEGVNVAAGDQVSFVALRAITEGGEEAMPEQVLAIRKEPGDERTIVISETTPGLIRAMDSYARQKANPNTPEWMSMRPGSYLLVHVTGEAIAQMGHDDPSRILEKAREVRIEAGETAGEMYMDAMIEADDVDIVNQISAIANGLMAMGRLALSSEPEGEHIISLINGTRITTQDTTMHVQFRMEASKLAETFRALHELDHDHEDGHHDEVEIRITTDDENL